MKLKDVLEVMDSVNYIHIFTEQTNIYYGRLGDTFKKDVEAYMNCTVIKMSVINDFLIIKI